MNGHAELQQDGFFSRLCCARRMSLSRDHAQRSRQPTTEYDLFLTDCVSFMVVRSHAKCRFATLIFPLTIITARSVVEINVHTEFQMAGTKTSRQTERVRVYLECTLYVYK